MKNVAQIYNLNLNPTSLKYLLTSNVKAGESTANMTSHVVLLEI